MLKSIWVNQPVLPSGRVVHAAMAHGAMRLRCACGRSYNVQLHLRSFAWALDRRFKCYQSKLRSTLHDYRRRLEQELSGRIELLSKQEMESAWKDKVQDIEIHCQRLCNDLTDKYHLARGRLRVQEEQSTLALNTAIDAAEAVLQDLVENTKDLRDQDGSADQATSQLHPLPLQSVDNTHHRIDCAPVMTFDVNVSNSPVIGFLPMPSLPPGPPPLLVPLGPPPPPVPDPPPPPHPASEAAASRGAGSQVRNYSPADRQMLMATVNVSDRACQEELRNPSYEPQRRQLCISSLREG